MGRSLAVPTTALLFALLLVTISAQHNTGNALRSGRRIPPLPRHYYSQTVPFSSSDRLACVTTRCHIGENSRWEPRHVLFELRGGSDDIGEVSSDTGGISSSPPANIIESALPFIETLQTAMVSGVNVRGVGALAAVAALTILPLTALIKQSYAFVVGCGISLVTMSLAMMSAFGLWPPTKSLSGNKCEPACLLIFACLMHGFRMASMAILRDVTSGADPTMVEEDNDTSICPMTWLKRIPLAINVSVLYAVMMSPVLYALRGAHAVSTSATQRRSPLIDWIGVVVTCTGMALGATTDVYKYVVEPRDTKADDFNEAAETVLNGGVANLPQDANAAKFQLARYLNIFGEGLFWVGLCLGGMSSFGNDVIAWLCGTLTVAGVVGFMLVPFLLHQLLSRIKYGHEDH